MKTLKTSRWLALTALLTAAACDDLGTAPSLRYDELTFEDQLALQALENPQAIQAALDLAGASDSPSPWHSMGHGMNGTEPSPHAEQARARFHAAQKALMAGDITRAAHEAREARHLVTQGMRQSRGDGAVSAMVERMEDLALTATMDPGRLQDAELLGQQLGMLAESARASMASGDMSHAGSLGVLGEQRIAQCNGTGVGVGTGTGTGQSQGEGRGNGRGHGMGHGMGHRMGTGTGHGTGNGQPGWMHGGTQQNVELVVALGSVAFDLATEILAESGSDEEQQAYLTAAGEAQLEAEEAFLAGDLARARYLAGLAQWQSLKAIVLPGGVTEDEVLAMLDLAQGLFEVALAAVGDAPTELQADLLARAEAMIQMSTGQLGAGGSMRINPLWRAAVISSYLASTAGEG